MTYTTIHSFRFFILAILLSASFFSTNTQADAYFTTHQEVVPLKNGSALFLIDYAFGMEKRDVYLPVFARNTASTSNNFVSYSILDGHNTEAKGTINGIVLSDTPIKDSMYITPKGHQKNFRLAVLFTPLTATPQETYRLQVNYLPFNFDGTQQLQLNPSELQYYTTKPTRL